MYQYYPTRWLKKLMSVKKLQHIVMSGERLPGEAEGEINGVSTEDLGMDEFSEHWWDGEIRVQGRIL